MLNRKQVHSLLLARQREGNFFSHLPVELIREISEFGRDDIEFNKALHHVAYGELDAVDAILAAASQVRDKTKLKALLLLSGIVVTPAGLTVKHTTLFECALGSGDPEMVAMIKPYFSNFVGGEEELERQLARYRPCIVGLHDQKPDDLIWLFDIVKKSNAADVIEELCIGEQYDETYQSPLRQALNQFREKKLEQHVRIMTKPRLHFNYKNLAHAHELLDAYWNDLGHDGICLVSQEIVGLIGLVELPAYERYVFSQCQLNEAAAGKKIVRSFYYKYGPGMLFPHYDRSLLNSHAGDVFDALISMYGSWWGGGPSPARDLEKLMASKHKRLTELIQYHPKAKPSGCVVI